MSKSQPYIGVDWGTSRMRAMLCYRDQSTAAPPEILLGQGVSRIAQPISHALFDVIAPWVDRYGTLDIVLAGMVGSNIGWRTTDYAACPLSTDDWFAHRLEFSEHGHAVSILPGVRCQNSLGQPDLMRGEELQILGWMALNASAETSPRLLCLPGTHTKWAQVENGQLIRFGTSLTGELFALLKEHSVLLPPSNAGATPDLDVASFKQGLAMVSDPETALLHTLFSARARALTRTDDIADPASYLSGMLIGSDVGFALKHYAQPDIPVDIIGDQALCQKFAIALDAAGVSTHQTDGNEAAYHGFLSLPL